MSKSGKTLITVVMVHAPSVFTSRYFPASIALVDPLISEIRTDQEDHEIIYKRCPVRKGDVLYIKDGAIT